MNYEIFSCKYVQNSLSNKYKNIFEWIKVNGIHLKKQLGLQVLGLEINKKMGL
ncbi:hypothetical protein [Clostridium sporogenes]|uniref:hypothetical protein n=1 Tax=Clostridium sporogenes TaxID=1509 RepID=UPI0022370BA4|nr:hypothetical protein [Clostridium sporogenes]MCW6111076.1 hypothetical protein [Clostridium sporogenes]